MKRTRWAPTVIGFLLAALALLLGLASARHGGSTGVVAAELLPSPSHFALFAFGSGATGMLLSHRHSRAACTTSIGTLVVLILLAVAGRTLGPSHEEGSYRSPNQQLEIRVSTTSPAIRPTQRVRLQQVRGPRSRYWEVGCLRGDSTVVQQVHWVSDESVELTIDGKPHLVQVSPAGPVRIPPAMRRC